MLIVAVQDDVDNLFAIYDTVSDRFIGVNLNEDCAIALIRNIKNCSREDAESRVNHPQPFSDIAKAIDVYDEAYKIYDFRNSGKKDYSPNVALIKKLDKEFCHPRKKKRPIF